MGSCKRLKIFQNVRLVLAVQTSILKELCEQKQGVLSETQLLLQKHVFLLTQPPLTFDDDSSPA